MADWPATIGVTRQNYSETPPNRVMRSSMDVGPQKIRRRSSNAVRPVSFRMFLTEDQVQTLDDFYYNNDALSFNFTDPRTDTVMRARFVEPPAYVLNETMYDVSLKLEYLF